MDEEDDSDSDEAGGGGNGGGRHRTRVTNAFSLAFEHSHYALALELFERYSASIQHSPELVAAIGGQLPVSELDRETVRASILTLQRLCDVSVALQYRIIAAADGAGDVRAHVSTWLESECGGDEAGARMRAAVINFPDAFGRCALHTAVAYQLPHILEYLLDEGGFHAIVRPCTVAEAGTDAFAARHLIHAPSASAALSSSARDTLRHKTLVELALETNHLVLVYLLLGRGARR